MTLPPIWTPTTYHQTNSRMAKFLTWIEATHQRKFADYQQLHQWSCEQPADFWQAVSDFLNFRWHQKPQQIFQAESHLQDSKWFSDGQFNFAENLLAKDSDETALTSIDETGTTKSFTWQQLRQQVAACAEGLRQNGVQPGDRVVGILPNNHYPIIAMLASASIGAIWASCSTDFGAQAIIDRLGQIDAKVCFIVDGHIYHGKQHSAKDKLQTLQQALSSVSLFVLCPNIGENLTLDKKKTMHWDSFLVSDAALTHHYGPFNQPLYVLFSSGTTGKPKCMVHGAGGTLIQHMKELALHTDIHEGDNLCFYTTTGWMMWNWMVSALSLGCQLTLYEGSPSYPDHAHLFELIEQHRITHFGTGAKFISSCQKSHLNLTKQTQLPSLKIILSTGSPLLPKNYDYVHEAIKADIPICSISGGSDIIGCFALGNPLLPVYRGELQCIGLGMDVAVYNEQGQAVVGEKGELVCRNAHPSMPLYFWHDEDGSKYKNAYFNRFKGVWAHGDFAEITEHQGVIIHGRADATLNPGGVRIGTAEIYRQLEKLDDIIDSVVVGQPWHDDERIILFVQLPQNDQLTDERIKEIKQYIRQHTSPRHVPAVIKQVTAIPRTLSGKVVELAVKQILIGQEVNNVEAIANPECLEQFKLPAEESNSVV